MEVKEKLYNLIAHTGINVMQKIFPEYFATEPMRPTDRYIEYPWVIEALSRYPINILDVGCSGSMLPLMMCAIGHKVMGVDIRPYPMDNPNFLFQQIDVEKLLFDSHFHIVTAVSTVEHMGLNHRYGIVEDAEKDLRAIEAMHQVLLPSGVLLMTVPFGEEYEVTKNHRIYNSHMLDLLMYKFHSYNYDVVPSPEADYQIALIKAVK